MSNKQQLLYLLSKKTAMVDEQFGCITISQFLDSGWTNTERVFENLFLPLLRKSEKIILCAYKPNWAQVYQGELPPWTEVLHNSINKKGRQYFIKNDETTIHNLFEYWINPSFLVKNTQGFGKVTIRPGIPVIEIHPDVIDVEALVTVSQTFGSVSNPWAGGYESARRYIKKHKIETSHLFVPLKGFASLHFFGQPKSVGRLVDEVMIQGKVMDQIEQHCPAGWQDQFEVKENETVEAAAERSFLSLDWK